MIQSVNKYYKNALVNTELNIYEIVISANRGWMFDILNRVYVNRNSDGEKIDIAHPRFIKGARCKYGYKADGVSYSIFTKRYLNGNTLCVIKLADDNL